MCGDDTPLSFFLIQTHADENPEIAIYTFLKRIMSMKESVYEEGTDG